MILYTQKKIELNQGLEYQRTQRCTRLEYQLEYQMCTTLEYQSQYLIICTTLAYQLQHQMCTTLAYQSQHQIILPHWRTNYSTRCVPLLYQSQYQIICTTLAYWAITAPWTWAVGTTLLLGTYWHLIICTTLLAYLAGTLKNSLPHL